MPGGRPARGPGDAAAPQRSGERHTLQITGIAAGGAGVGRLADGRVAFVQRTAPGDRVDVSVVEEKARWVRARLRRIRSEGPDRRAAPCPHYVNCGGCTLEHITYDAQRRAKADIVREALRRIGAIEIDRPEVVASPQEFHYRNRVSFTLLRLGGGRVVAGFHELERPDRIADIDDRCLLPEASLTEAWRGLRAEWGVNASRLPAGSSLRLTLRATHAGNVTLLIEGGYGQGRPAELLERIPGLAGIWRRARDGTITPLAGESHVTEDWHGETVDLAGGMFLQVNRDAAALLEEHVIAAAGDLHGRPVVDAYCGVGLYARRLARAGARVTGIEMDALAVVEARRRSDRATFREGRVEALLPGVLPAALVIVNPPRAGVDAAVCDALRATPPARLIYVSCDPATLARDLGRLGPQFELRTVTCFDLFPQTAHVETVAVLACATT